MDRDQFRFLLRDALANIHDYVALEKHPLNELVPRSDPSVRRVENFRRYIWDGIEALKPRTPQQVDSLEWRYYRILSGRYIEGASVLEMQMRLALGERQERRLHGRAVSVLADVLWNRLYASRKPGSEPSPGSSAISLLPPLEKPPVPAAAGEGQEEDFSFPVTLEPLHLVRILNDTIALFLPQLQARGGDLSIQSPANLPMVQADRIILRQILLHVFNRILQSWAGEEVFIHTSPGLEGVLLEILSQAEPAQAHADKDPLADQLLAYWVERLNARLSVEAIMGPDDPQPTAPIHLRYILELPAANQATILVVDDHEPAIRIIQRYLSQTNIQAIGLTDPTEIVSLARSLHPQAILLDIMMPGIDGWEILQKLKSDPETHAIPIIICSVWDQPDLAYSLGANGFLKKPISQPDLLAELNRSGLPDISDEPLPEGS